MAVRLAAVLIQTPSSVPGGTELVDGVVGELIGAPGIDLTLVGPHSTWGDTSTDRMTIESLPTDAAVLDWADASGIEGKMQSVDPSWTRSRHAGDRSIPIAPNGCKRLFAFDLSGFRSAAEVCQALKALLDSRQVKTVDVALGGKALAALPNAPSTPDSIPHVSIESPALSPRNDTTDLDLDDLVDQLDELDP